MELTIPESLRTEHDELRGQLAQLAREKGRLGSAASALLRAIRHHADREEEFAFPPLSLLFPLAGGRLSAEMRDVLPLTDKMKQELPSLLAEHSTIVTALRKLKEAALEEKRHDCAELAERIISHIQSEEDILYPVSILIGEYVKLKLGR